MNLVRLDSMTERLKRAVRQQFPAARFRVVQDIDDEHAWGLFVYSDARSAQIHDITIDEVSRNLIEEELAVYVVAAHPEDYDSMPLSDDPAIDAMLKEPLGAPVRLTRKQALAAIRSGIGARPDLPPGTKYVRQVREAWQGLVDRGTVSS